MTKKSTNEKLEKKTQEFEKTESEHKPFTDVVKGVFFDARNNI